MQVSALSAKHQSTCVSWELYHVSLCHLSNLGHVALLAFIPGLNYLKMVDSYCLMKAWVLCTQDSGYSQGRRIWDFIKLWSLVAVLSMTQWVGKQWYLTRTAFIHFLLVRTVFPLETTKWAARIKMDHTVGWNRELMTKSDRERWTEVWVLVKSCWNDVQLTLVKLHPPWLRLLSRRSFTEHPIGMNLRFPWTIIYF